MFKIIFFLIGLAASAPVGFAAYHAGSWVGAGKAEAAAMAEARARALEAELEAKGRDLAAAQIASHRAAEAATSNAQAAEAAEERVRDYEKALLKRGDPGRCQLGADDVEWLRPRAGASADHPSPPARPRRRS